MRVSVPATHGQRRVAGMTVALIFCHACPPRSRTRQSARRLPWSATASACSSSASWPRCSRCAGPSWACRGTTSRSPATTSRRCRPPAVSASCRRTHVRILSRAGTIVIPNWRDLDEPPPPAMLEALRAAHQRGAPADVGVLRRLRAGRRRAARRQARHHALAPRGQTGGEVPERAGRAVGALRPGRPGLHRRRQRRRHRPRPAPGPSGLRLGDRQPGGPADGRAAPSRGRPERSSSPPRAGRRRTARWRRSWSGRAGGSISRSTPSALARKATMSLRTLARRFESQAGTTPHQWLTHQRVLAAQRLLETSDASIERVAELSGFMTPETLRHHFRRRVGTSPGPIGAGSRSRRDRANPRPTSSRRRPARS